MVGIALKILSCLFLIGFKVWGRRVFRVFLGISALSLIATPKPKIPNLAATGFIRCGAARLPSSCSIFTITIIKSTDPPKKQATGLGPPTIEQLPRHIDVSVPSTAGVAALQLVGGTGDSGMSAYKTRRASGFGSCGCWLGAAFGLVGSGGACARSPEVYNKDPII